MVPAGAFPNLTFPVIAAPMFLVSGVDLVTAMCREGMIGAFPAANARTPERLAEWLAEIRDKAGATAAPYAVNINLRPGRYGDLTSVVDVCRKAAAPIVITSVGDPTEMAKNVHDWGGLVMHDVTTIRHAEKAVEAGVDGLILVCAGAGGHSGAASAFSFVRAVRKFHSGILVLAGGIADGHGVAAARMLGADLVYMGTRFIASREAMASDGYKQMVIASGLPDILYTDAISGLPANFLVPSIIAAQLDPKSLPRPDGHQSHLPGPAKAWRDIWSAGHAVALIDDAPSVNEIAARLRAEYAAARSDFLARNL